MGGAASWQQTAGDWILEKHHLKHQDINSSNATMGLNNKKQNKDV